MEEFLDCKNLRIAARTDPAGEVSGDFFDVISHPDGSTCLGIGDVTGHGLASGVVMLMVKDAFRSALKDPQSSLGQGLIDINAALFHSLSLMKDVNNMTLSILRYAEGLVTLSGQHESILLLKKGGAAAEHIETADLGMFIGLESDISDYVTERNVPLMNGDMLLMYTDGATDAENSSRTGYGIERLEQSFLRFRERPVEGIVDAMMDDIYDWTKGTPIDDDITLMLVMRMD